MAEGILSHNRTSRASEDQVMRGPDRQGQIVILTKDGRLFGLFKSRSDAAYWAVSQNIPCCSTYDLLSPANPDQEPPRD